MAFHRLKEWFRNRRKKQDLYKNSSPSIHDAASSPDDGPPFVLLDKLSDDTHHVPSHTGRGEYSKEGADGGQVRETPLDPTTNRNY